MKKFYTFTIGILAFLTCKSGISTMLEHAEGFATAELSSAFSIGCLSAGWIIITVGLVYKFTPKI